MATATAPPQHVQAMELALSEAKKCEPSPTAFCVGCVITNEQGDVISTGYSRELPGNTHAEQCALDKLDPSVDLSSARLYSTMEPCSVRLSGNKPCADRILDTEIKHVFVGVLEPKDFVECEGVHKLAKAGVAVEVVESGDLGERCLREARRGR